jgi:hypothetical protein
MTFEKKHFYTWCAGLVVHALLTVYKEQPPVWIAQSLYKKLVKIPDLLYVCKKCVVRDRILIVVNLAVKANTYVHVIVTKHERSVHMLCTCFTY